LDRVGSVLPDIALMVFYFWDNHDFHHHNYLTHRLALGRRYWVSELGLFWLGPASALTGLGIGGLIHMVLDSIAGKIA
jgi:inner membrane protein